MIRQYNNRTVQVENGVTKYLADIFCNSTDTKPTANLVNGSKLTEVDTGKTFLYDEADTEWVEYSAGGGGGGVVPVTFTNITPSSQTTFSATASMTGAEILNAILEGKSVNAVIDGRPMNMGVLQIPLRGTDDGVDTYVWGMSIIHMASNPIAIDMYANLVVYLESNNARLTLLLEN